MLAQLYEAGRFHSGHLGKIAGSVSYASLAEGTMKNLVQMSIWRLKR